jgi:hypothetical protein
MDILKYQQEQAKKGDKHYGEEIAKMPYHKVSGNKISIDGEMTDDKTPYKEIPIPYGKYENYKQM